MWAFGVLAAVEGVFGLGPEVVRASVLLMDKILHDPKDPKLWELWYIPYNGYCRILSINSITFFWKAGGNFRG